MHQCWVKDVLSHVDFNAKLVFVRKLSQIKHIAVTDDLILVMWICKVEHSLMITKGCIKDFNLSKYAAKLYRCIYAELNNLILAAGSLILCMSLQNMFTNGCSSFNEIHAEWSFRIKIDFQDPWSSSKIKCFSKDSASLSWSIFRWGD